MTNKEFRSQCPISCSLEILGDKWTLILVRDLMSGGKTYNNLQSGKEGIPTNILASRLKMLVEDGIVTKTAYQQKPIRFRYELTEKGRALWPVLKELIRWGDRYIEGAQIGNKLRQIIENV